MRTRRRHCITLLDIPKLASSLIIQSHFSQIKWRFPNNLSYCVIPSSVQNIDFSSFHIVVPHYSGYFPFKGISFFEPIRVKIWSLAKKKNYKLKQSLLHNGHLGGVYMKVKWTQVGSEISRLKFQGGAKFHVCVHNTNKCLHEIG